MQVIYVDVLLGTNLFVDFCLLLLNAKFLHLEPKKGRLILGASVGAVGSLIVLVPTMETWVSFIYQLLLAAIITYCAFGFCGRALFLRQLLSFYVMSFAFAGIMLVLWYFLAPKGLFIKNNVVYFDVPPVLFIVLVGVCYFIMRIFHRITGRGAVANID
ncbi:MAG: sigma-E processing peptidase SpoIIGA, partial [Oscillospiraceae bacterium]|nr:sigma-E processing peptidase SpoIIGA [Oscillospiraceae bacterium]